MDEEKTGWPNDEHAGPRGFCAALEDERWEPSAAQQLDGCGDVSATVDLRVVPIEAIRPHPLNPRFHEDEELIKGCEAAARKRGGCDRTQPLVVRAVGEHLQLISGHHRFVGYQRAGLAEVMVHVVTMTDAEAMIALDTYNRHNPLGSMELARHAARLLDLGHAATQKEAADMLDLDEGQVSRGFKALAVYEAHAANCAGSTHALRDHVEHLYAIRKLPAEVQKAIVERIVNDGLSKAEVLRLVAEQEQANGAERKKCSPKPTSRETSQVTIKLTEHVNRAPVGDNVRLYPIEGPLPDGIALHLREGKLFLAVGEVVVTNPEPGSGEPKSEPAPPASEDAAAPAEPTRETMTINDVATALDTLPVVEPTADVADRLKMLGIDVTTTMVRSTGGLDAYQVVFGATWANWLRMRIEFADTKAKKKLQQLDIIHTDKVSVPGPRPSYAGRPVVLVLADGMLGVGKYDDAGKAPGGQVVVVTDGHAVLVDAAQVECDQCLIFRSAELNWPTSPVETATQ